MTQKIVVRTVRLPASLFLRRRAAKPLSLRFDDPKLDTPTARQTRKPSFHCARIANRPYTPLPTSPPSLSPSNAARRRYLAYKPFEAKKKKAFHKLHGCKMCATFLAEGQRKCLRRSPLACGRQPSVERKKEKKSGQRKATGRGPAVQSDLNVRAKGGRGD